MSAPAVLGSRCFIDTNVLIYTDDADSPRKRDAAVALLETLGRTGRAVLSIQVLQEYFAVSTRKLGLDAAVAQRRMELFATFEVVIPSVELLMAAVNLHRLQQVAFWDALIVQAAAISGCDTLLTEDFQANRMISGVRVVNPFAAAD